jgi:hypothetical protein
MQSTVAYTKEHHREAAQVEVFSLAVKFAGRVEGFERWREGLATSSRRPDRNMFHQNHICEIVSDMTFLRERSNRNLTTMEDSLTDFIAGSAGGFAGKLLDYPLDTVKVLLQTQNVGNSTATTATAESASSRVVYRGAIHCLQHTVKTNGFFSLYRGLSSPLLGSMAENAVLFLAYSNFKRQLGEVTGEKDLSLLQLSLAGAGAGAVVTFVLTPVELIKCRLQVQNAGLGAGFRTYKGPIDVVLQTVKTEGIVKGLYRGNTATLLREIPGNFCWYGVYEGVCKLMIPEGGTKADLGTSSHLLGGTLLHNMR